MPVVSKYCDKCGIKIPVEDFEDGHALEYQQAYYCRNCKGSVVPTPEPPPPPPEPPAPPPERKVWKAPRSKRIEKITGKKHEVPGDADGGAPRKSSAPRKEAGGRTAAPPRKRAASESPGPAAPGKRKAGEGGKVAPPPGKAVSGKQVPGAKGTPGMRRREAGRTGSERIASRKGTGRVASGTRRGVRKKGTAERRRPREEERVEEKAEERGSSRKFLLIGGIGSVLVIVVVLLFVALGRGGGETEGGTGTDGDGETGEAAPAASKVEQALLDEVKGFIGDFPEDVEGIEDEVSRARSQIKDPTLSEELERVWREARDDAYRILGQRTDEILQNVEDITEAEEYDLALKTLRDDVPREMRETARVLELQEKILRFKKADDEVRWSLSRASRLASQGKFVEAQGTLDAINLEEYRDTPIYGRIQAQIDAYRNAKWTEEDKSALSTRLEKSFEKLKARVKKYASPGQREYDLAVQILENAIREYEGTEFEGQVRAMIDKVQVAFKEDLLTLVGSKGEPLIGSNDMMWRMRDGDQTAWKLKDRIFKGEASSGGATIGYQDSRWRDYVIQFEAKVFLGDLALGMRIGYGSSGLDYAKIRLKEAGRSWQTFRFAVMGSKYYRMDPETGDLELIKVKHKGDPREKGAIAFIIEKKGSVQVRKATYWPIK